MNKKLFTFALLATLLPLAGCKDNEPANEQETPIEEAEETYVVDNKLIAPEVSLEGNIISWKENKCADYYTVYVDGKYLAKTIDTFFALEDRINGNFIVKVRAYDSCLRFEESDFSNEISYVINKKNLSAPNVTVNGDILSWPEVEGADNYKVFLNGGWQNLWKISKKNGVYSCKMDFANSGTYKIDVAAYSSNLEYEKEKFAPQIMYKISLDKIWYSTTFFEDWKINGEARIENDKVVINPNKLLSVTTIENNLLIEDDHPYLYVTFEDSLPIATDFVVLVNQTLISPIAQELLDPAIPANTFVYDLTFFSGLAASVKINCVQGKSFNITGMRLFTNNNKSSMEKWSGNQFIQDWILSGKYENHPEGFCLESNGNRVSMTNYFHLEHCKLTFLMRMFVRPGIKDASPIVYLYANGNVVKPIGSTVSYASVDTDAFESFSYDLSAYLNTDVEIKVESIEGPHACFYSLELGD